MQRGSTPRWVRRGSNSMGPFSNPLSASTTLTLPCPFPALTCPMCARRRRSHVRADLGARTRMRGPLTSTRRALHLLSIGQGVPTPPTEALARFRRSGPGRGRVTERAGSLRRGTRDQFCAGFDTVPHSRYSQLACETSTACSGGLEVPV